MNKQQLTDFYTTTFDRISTSKGWWSIGQNYNNKDVFSCREAVHYRDRLGSGETGVPLWTELKSQIIAIKYINTKKVSYVISHTRANTIFNQSRLLEVLKIAPELVEVDNILEDSNIDQEVATQRDSPIFGLVNPLNVDKILKSQKPIDQSSIIQIFDKSLLLHGGYPDTIMTNAGVRSKYLEVSPENLITCVRAYFDNVRVEQISIPDPIWLGLEGKFVKDEWTRFPPATGPKIGILTGNSPESGLTLWNDFLDQYRNFSSNLADVLMPEVIVYSLPQMGLSMELVKREKEVWKEMKKSIKILLDSGCKLITIACNTTIYFAPLIEDLCKPYKAKFISIAEACLPEIKYQLNKKDNGSCIVGLVGIGPVIDVEGGYSGYAEQFKSNGIGVVHCDATDLAWAIKRVGTSDSKDEIQSLVGKFRSIMNGPLSDTKIVVLALTEVSLIYRKHIQKLPKKYKVRKRIIDPVFELSRYLVYLYLLFGMRENKVCQFPQDYPLEQKLKELIYKK